ncbi:MAG TPA: aminotransferase class V-fold PLP-dependent enzyme [Bryobacteraceae bacterium]|nr:aminotransferase class V-fold PLP-dependent enzyme [Bryobacteraceae bacterium]
MWRHEFPVTDRYVYLNHAAVAPLTRRSAEAMQALAGDCLLHGSNHYEAWLKVYDGVRKAAAKLIHAEPAEIALVKNTSEGIATVALGIDWKAGDKIVVFVEEFPANQYCWSNLEAQGVSLIWRSIYDPLERIEEACRGARLLAVSYVNYLSGYKVDLCAIGEICRRHETFFFVDAIQGLGAFPLDVRASGIHALAADGHKWLLGPEGCGLLYIQRDRQDSIVPAELGWTNVAHFADYASRDMTLRSDAGRYECGTLNTIGCHGLYASLQLLLEVGVEQIAGAVRHLGDRIADGVQARGFELAVPRTAETGAGIVSFRKKGLDARVLVHNLKEQGMLAAPRQGWVRTSPHFYVSPEEIDRFLAAL